MSTVFVSLNRKKNIYCQYKANIKFKVLFDGKTSRPLLFQNPSRTFLKKIVMNTVLQENHSILNFELWNKVACNI